MRAKMVSLNRPEWSTERVFYWVLLGSLLVHFAMFLFVMNVEPPPPPSQEEYASWLKKVTPPRVVEEEAPKKKVEKPKVEKEKEEEKEALPEKAPKAAPVKGKAQVKPAQAERRAEIRKQLSGAGLLASIGAQAEEGGLANVFESGEAIGKDLEAALSERGSVRVSGDARIGKKGALGAETSADIGEIKAGAGGSAGVVGGRKGTVPQAFVKSGEAVISKGGIDPAKVNMALKRRERGIQQCYENALKTNPKLQGQVSLSWTIDESGLVLDKIVKVIKNTLGNAEVGDCIARVISTIRFPKPERGAVPVTKTFEFKAGG